MKLSATAIQQWLDCPRAFWWQRVVGRKQPETAAMALGTAVHAEIEHFLGTHTWKVYQPDRPEWLPVRIASAGQEYLEPLAAEVASGGAEVEAGFSMPAGVFGLYNFTGRIDYRSWANGPRIVDHKTTSDLKAPWHLDAEGMASNLQLRIYAAVAFPDDWGAVRVGHIYYLTVPPFGSRQLHVTVEREALRRTRDDVHTITEAIAKVADVKDASRQDTIPSRRSNCSKYGGCPHRTYCSDSPANAEAKLKQLFAAANKVVLPEKGPMPLFNRAKTPAPTPVDLELAERMGAPAVVTVAPGQIRPTDAPASPSPTKPELLRNMLRASIAPGAVVPVGSVRSAGAVLGMDEAGFAEALALGTLQGWWLIESGNLVMPGSGAFPTTAPDAPSVPATAPNGASAPAAESKPVDPAREAVMSSIEALVGRFGEDRVKATADNLGLKRWRRAGTETLQTLLTALQGMTDAKPATVSAGGACEMLRSALAGNAGLAAEDPGAWGEISLVELRTELAEILKVERDAVALDLVCGACNAGADLGYWVYGGRDTIAPVWAHITAGAAPALQAPQTRSQVGEVSAAAARAAEDLAAAADALNAAPAAEPTEAVADPVAETSDGWPVRPFVFVGCIPVATHVHSLEDWLAEPIAELEASADDDFWRYNRMPSTLANGIKLALRLGELKVPAMLYIPARHPWESHIVPVLAAFGCTVVRALA